jgi:hypothetical protein
MGRIKKADALPITTITVSTVVRFSFVVLCVLCGKGSWVFLICAESAQICGEGFFAPRSSAQIRGKWGCISDDGDSARCRRLLRAYKRSPYPANPLHLVNLARLFHAFQRIVNRRHHMLVFPQVISHLSHAVPHLGRRQRQQ